MTKKRKDGILRRIFLGKKYAGLGEVDEQIRFLSITYILLAVIFPLIIFGFTSIRVNVIRAVVDFSLALLCVVSLILIRSKIPLKFIPIIPATFFGIYCLYLIYEGSLNLWVSVWIFAFPLIIIYLCKMTFGVIESTVVLIFIVLFMYTPISPHQPDNSIRIRYIGAYVFVMALAIIYEFISNKKDKKEAALKAEISYDRDIIQAMQDNIPQGIFLMNKELKILPQYSKPLVSILSYYDSDLAGKNFLDILSSSLDGRQLQIMKGYFEMIFEKSKSQKILESVNPISEFLYKADDRKKFLSSSFYLIEEEEPGNVILGIIQDITKEKEFEKELHEQKEAQEMEMKNMFDIIQIDPLVFQDFIEDAESNFNYINLILKDRTISEKQVVNKFFQNIHAIKSNAIILGLETFARKLHYFEDDIKLLTVGEVKVDDILSLAIKLETLMQEKDNYITIVRKIEAFKNSNQVDTILIHTMNKAVEKTAAETQKKVELKSGYLDMGILESRLRRPIKDILFQCIRNSIYHGIETVEERIQKGKRPQGFLTFSIKNSEGSAEVTFSDDGRGLDWKKIKDKYLEKHKGAKNPSKKILLSSIFSPEFSTADETSMTAGRGIGLSLVKDLVKQNHGTIKVDSSESGLTIKFTLPMPK